MLNINLPKDWATSIKLSNPPQHQSPLGLFRLFFVQYDYFSTKKGHTFKICVMAVDQVGNPMTATIRSSVVSESGLHRLKEGQTEQEVGNQCTELEYNVFSQDS